MASAVKQLLKMEKIGYDIFNLGRGMEYSAVDIVDAFERQLKEKVKIEVDPARVRKVEREHLLADVSKLKKAAGWNRSGVLMKVLKTLFKAGIYKSTIIKIL